MGDDEPSDYEELVDNIRCNILTQAQMIIDDISPTIPEQLPRDTETGFIVFPLNKVSAYTIADQVSEETNRSQSQGRNATEVSSMIEQPLLPQQQQPLDSQEQDTQSTRIFGFMENLLREDTEEEAKEEPEPENDTVPPNEQVPVQQSTAEKTQTPADVSNQPSTGANNPSDNTVPEHANEETRVQDENNTTQASTSTHQDMSARNLLGLDEDETTTIPETQIDNMFTSPVSTPVGPRGKARAMTEEEIQNMMETTPGRDTETTSASDSDVMEHEEGESALRTRIVNVQEINRLKRKREEDDRKKREELQSERENHHRQEVERLRDEREKHDFEERKRLETARKHKHGLMWIDMKKKLDQTFDSEAANKLKALQDHDKAERNKYREKRKKEQQELKAEMIREHEEDKRALKETRLQDDVFERQNMKEKRLSDDKEERESLKRKRQDEDENLRKQLSDKRKQDHENQMMKLKKMRNDAEEKICNHLKTVHETKKKELFKQRQDQHEKEMKRLQTDRESFHRNRTSILENQRLEHHKNEMERLSKLRERIHTEELSEMGTGTRTSAFVDSIIQNDVSTSSDMPPVRGYVMPEPELEPPRQETNPEITTEAVQMLMQFEDEKEARRYTELMNHQPNNDMGDKSTEETTEETTEEPNVKNTESDETGHESTGLGKENDDLLDEIRQRRKDGASTDDLIDYVRLKSKESRQELVDLHRAAQPADESESLKTWNEMQGILQFDDSMTVDEVMIMSKLEEELSDPEIIKQQKEILDKIADQNKQMRMLSNAKILEESRQVAKSPKRRKSAEEGHKKIDGPPATQQRRTSDPGNYERKWKSTSQDKDDQEKEKVTTSTNISRPPPQLLVPQKRNTTTGPEESTQARISQLAATSSQLQSDAVQRWSMQQHYRPTYRFQQQPLRPSLFRPPSQQPRLLCMPPQTLHPNVMQTTTVVRPRVQPSLLLMRQQFIEAIRQQTGKDVTCALDFLDSDISESNAGDTTVSSAETDKNTQLTYTQAMSFVEEGGEDCSPGKYIMISYLHVPFWLLHISFLFSLLLLHDDCCMNIL